MAARMTPSQDAGVPSPTEIANIMAEIERLEKLRNECTDNGIRKRIEAWIKTEKKKLDSEPKS